MILPVQCPAAKKTPPAMDVSQMGATSGDKAWVNVFDRGKRPVRDCTPMKVHLRPELLLAAGCLNNGSYNCLLFTEAESLEYYEYIVTPKNDPTVCNCICNQDHPCPGDMFIANYRIFVGTEKVGTHI